MQTRYSHYTFHYENSKSAICANIVACEKTHKALDTVHDPHLKYL